jgi:hypothetical protein
MFFRTSRCATYKCHINLNYASHVATPKIYRVGGNEMLTAHIFKSYHTIEVMIQVDDLIVIVSCKSKPNQSQYVTPSIRIAINSSKVGQNTSSVVSLIQLNCKYATSKRITKE